MIRYTNMSVSLDHILLAYAAQAWVGTGADRGHAKLVRARADRKTDVINT